MPSATSLPGVTVKHHCQSHLTWAPIAWLCLVNHDTQLVQKLLIAGHPSWLESWHQSSFHHMHWLTAEGRHAAVYICLSGTSNLASVTLISDELWVCIHVNVQVCAISSPSETGFHRCWRQIRRRKRLSQTVDHRELVCVAAEWMGSRPYPLTEASSSHWPINTYNRPITTHSQTTV